MWTSKVQSRVFTKITDEFSADLKTKYNMTDANFSVVDSNNKKSIFPFVFIKQISPYEIPTDLERHTITLATFTFQIDCYDNQSQQRVRNVADEVLRIMKKYQFTCQQIPVYESENGVHRAIARYTLMTGEEDYMLNR